MRITYPEIIDWERFGECRNEGYEVCCFCMKKIDMDCETKIIDRFGCVFCDNECENRYYGRKREGLM